MSRKLAFTICSINYLAQAKVLQKSLQETNPDFDFKIGLCDRLDKVKITPEKIDGLDIVEVHTIGIPAFDAMCDRYDITELNTAIKPFYFSYFFELGLWDKILYIDPDIQFFDSLALVNAHLENSDILLTPHFSTPIFDGKEPSEQKMFVNGIYNLGFLGLRKSEQADAMLHWWKAKLEKECFMDIQNGMFVDQLYCNMVPLYFKNVAIEKNAGLNMAYWNLHERVLSKRNGEYFANEEPLVFYHFSGMDAKNPDNISRWYKRFDLKTREDLRELFSNYRLEIERAGNSYFKEFTCFYIKPEPAPVKKSLLKRILTSVTFRVYHFFEKLPI